MDSAMLSALDDMLSDVLLDQTHLWFQTHKMNEGYQPLIVNPDDILTIIQRRVIVEKNLDAAVKDLVKIPVFEGVLGTKKQKQDFKSHAKKYFGMYLATAGFDISQTDRYTAVTKKLEACVIATRDFDEGAELAQCAGSTAALTEQQDGELESDFSVIRTSRRGTFLFLGPARFVNHDCNPNCRFMWANNTTICFRALRPIRTNDEITTSYGDSYFGANNKECLCATCESRGQGAFSGRGSGSEPSASGKVEGHSENAPPTRSLRSRKAVDYCLRKKPVKQCPTPPSPESSGGSESAPLPKKKLTMQQSTPLSPTSPGGSDSAPDTPTRDSTDAQALVTPVPTPTRLPKIEFPPFTDDEDDGDDVDSAGPRAPATKEDLQYLFPIESEVEDRLLYAMKGFHITESKGKEVLRDYVPDRNLQPAATRVKAWQITSASSSLSPPDSSKRNFRMSIDFLCSPSRDADIEVHQSDAQSDTHESTAKARTARTRTKSGKTAVVKEIDPDRCASCNTLTPREQKDDTGDCRRCHRHLLLYGVAWPSRSKDTLVAKFDQQEKQKRDALAKIAEDLKSIEKAEAAKAQAAAKAERAAVARARKNALAKEARAQARSATQAQAQVQKRQAQNPAQARAQLFTQAQAQDLYGFATAQAPHALLPASHGATRLVNIRPKPAMGSSYDNVPSGPYRPPPSNSVAHSKSHLPPPAMAMIGDIPSGPYRPLNNYDASQ
ncbi:Histone-lysine N-methyltransferase set9, partial [Mortierella alpina]